MATKPVRQLASMQRSDGRVRVRQGVVDAANSDGTIDVVLGADDVVIESVSLLGDAPAGAGVWMLQLPGGDLLALGATGPQIVTGQSLDARTEHGTDHGKNPEDFPVGISTSPTVAAAQGWPLATGARGAVVTTSTGAYVFQLLMSNNAADGVQFRSGDGTTWSAWATL